ncbi:MULTISPECIES: hypothetical protein [unclassified Chelatococcus]|uniref:hypothetical protein n=1 Tax=unclassified Chelatococcus TaxID=2638111 RepID=UPI001BD177CA|nr:MULTISPECIES: hypothetical protein [unclassified Chelatococcus]MBS7700047.1 hypothetical protein [Chelatococcus sp. YT9]MBX3556740.1 hypothetical protein [Chelatococcus sp.]
MLVYGDRSRCENSRDILDELDERARFDADPCSSWIMRHGQLVALFIRAAELVQGLEDARFKATGSDALVPQARARAQALRALAGSVLRSWLNRDLPHARAVGEVLQALRAASSSGTITTRTGEGYAYYAVYPESYGLAAQALAGAVTSVIGLRSIGAGLGAMVAARAGAGLFVTLRPFGDPFQRSFRLAPDLRAALARRTNGIFAVVDEGPGLSGSSMAGCAAALEALGAEPDRVHFFPSHGGLPGSEASEEGRSRWRRAPRHVVTLDDLVTLDGRSRAETTSTPMAMPLASWVEDLTGPPLGPLQDIGGGRWRDLRVYDPRPPGGGIRERRKFLLRCERGTFLLRFVGLGATGEAVLRRAKPLASAGFAPAVLGLRHGFLIEEWVDDARGIDLRADHPALIVRLADYLAFRARQLPAVCGDGASLETLAAMAERNCEILFGRTSAGRVLADRKAQCPPSFERVETDNRLHAWEWLRTSNGRILKTDAFDHCSSHDLVGCQNIAWDVAGACLELDLDGHSLAELIRLVGARGVSIHEPLLRFYLPCYAAFQAGSFYLDAQATVSEAERRILQNKLSKYKGYLSTSVFQV